MINGRLSGGEAPLSSARSVLAIPVVPFPPVRAAAATSRFRLNYHITAKKRHLGVGDLTKRSLEINVVKENGPA
jgi:hypothetical protein